MLVKFSSVLVLASSSRVSMDFRTFVDFLCRVQFFYHNSKPNDLWKRATHCPSKVIAKVKVAL